MYLAEANSNGHHPSPPPDIIDKKEVWRCLPLHRALLRGDQRGSEQLAESLFPHIPFVEAMSKKITGRGDTGLHVLVGAGKWFDDLMHNPTMIGPSLTLRNRDGHTPLCVAATVGNMQAARKLLLLEMKLPPTLRALNEAVGPYPIIEAARYGHREMVLLLIGDMDRTMEGSAPTKESTASLFLHLLVVAGFYDVLLDLVLLHPGLARAEFYGDNNESLLSLMAGKPSAFRSGIRLSFWQRLHYSGSVRTIFMLSPAIVVSPEFWPSTLTL